jgi:hypothetical protein
MGLNFYHTALLVISFAVPISRIFYISKMESLEFSNDMWQKCNFC